MDQVPIDMEDYTAGYYYMKIIKADADIWSTKIIKRN